MKETAELFLGFLKGVTRFEVDTELLGSKGRTGEVPASAAKWTELHKKHREQAQKSVDGLIASLRVGLEDSLTLTAEPSLPTSGAGSDTAAEKAAAEKVAAEKVAAEPDLKVVEALTKRDDYEAARSALLGYPQTAAVRKELGLVTDWLARAREISQLATLVESLVSEKKLPSALKLFQRMAEIRDRQPSMRGGSIPEAESAEKAYHLRKKEYDEDWLEYSHRSGELFGQMKWEALIELARQMSTWELFPGGDEQVRGNLARAEAGLKAQAAAWTVYREAERGAATGQLDNASWRSQTLQSLHSARNEFHQSDSRWTEIGSLINRIKGYSAPFSVRVEPPTCRISPGAEVRTVAHATGGVPPYSFEWFVGNERSGTLNQVKVWKLNQAGQFQLRVVATDSTGRQSEAVCLAQVVATQKSAPDQTPSVVEAPDPRGYRVTGGQASMGSRHEPNCRGNPFADGTWCSSRGGSDWLQNQLDAFHLVHEIRVEEFWSDVTTDGMKIQIKAHTPKGWILVDELHNTNINKTALTGGARANSVGPMVFPLSPPQRVDAVRLEIAGHGWFGAANIQMWATGSPTKTTQAPVDVSVAKPSHFVGNFVMTDPARSSDKYHGTLQLFENGQGRAREWLKGKPAKPNYPETADAEGRLPVAWSDDTQTGTFVLDWSMGGRLRGLGEFRGQVSGNTHDFILSGKWAGGKAGKLRFQRR